MDVKMEDDSPPIKADPDAASAAPLMEDDNFEDTGELEFPKDPVQAWLTRIPKVVWDQWATIDEDEEIQLGTIRHFKNSGKYHLLLNPALKQNARLPKEFDMKIIDRNSRNTFIFSEKDLPGYKSKAQHNARGDLIQSSRDENQATDGKSRGERPRRYQQYYRRSVPKRTALTAKIQREMHCMATEEDEYGNLIKARMEQEEKAKQGIRFIQDDVRKTTGTVLQSSITGGHTGFDNFISTGAKPGRLKSQENKSARIPQSDLLDLLYGCFSRFKYWKFRALKNELKQPEAYLKETLSMIAVLIRSGPFALTWMLKDQSGVNLDTIADEIAPDIDASDVDSAPDDDDMEMEDAL